MDGADGTLWGRGNLPTRPVRFRTTKRRPPYASIGPALRENPVAAEIAAGPSALPWRRMQTLVLFVAAILRSAFLAQRDLVLENAALRQQLAVYRRSVSAPG